MRITWNLVVWPMTWAMSLAVSVAAQSSTPDSFQYFLRSGGSGQAGTLPERFDNPGQLCWRKALDPGHSTPIISAGKIFLTTFNESSQELATVALDKQTGDLLWREVAPAAAIEPYHRTGSPAAPTPASDGQRLFVFFGSYGLLCYDTDGKRLWERPMGPFQDEFGSGSSPVLAGNKLILLQDKDVGSFVMAIDLYTGKTLWKADRPDAVRSYSTPVLWENDGQKQVVVAGALQLTGYDLGTGEKEWWVNGLARIVIPMPVVDSQRIYMASWAPGADSGARISLDSWETALSQWDANNDGKLVKEEIGDREVLSRFYRMDLDQSRSLNQQEWDRHSEVFLRAQNALLALRPEGKGDLTESAVLWKYHRGLPYVATPLLHNGMVWMVKDGGIVTKIDADTGVVLQEERLGGFGSYYASPVVGDGKVYFASESGVVTVVAEDRSWKVLSSHPFREKIYATPVIDGDRILIRTDKALYCFSGVPATDRASE